MSKLFNLLYNYIILWLYTMRYGCYNLLFGDLANVTIKAKFKVEDYEPLF